MTKKQTATAHSTPEAEIVADQGAVGDNTHRVEVAALRSEIAIGNPMACALGGAGQSATNRHSRQQQPAK